MIGFGDPFNFVILCNLLWLLTCLFAAPSVVSSSDYVRTGTRKFTLKGEGFNPITPSETNSVLIRVDSGIFFPCAVLDAGSDATTINCELANSSIITKSDATIYATVRSYFGKSEERAIGVISLTGISGTTIAGAAIGGSIGALIIIVLIILIILRTKIRRRLRDAKGTHVDVPQEMAHMFNIKSQDLEIIQKLGEGSFGAVFSAKWKGDIVALKKLTGAMISSHVNDFFREAVRAFQYFRPSGAALKAPYIPPGIDDGYCAAQKCYSYLRPLPRIEQLQFGHGAA
jgi:hypothetical protein